MLAHGLILAQGHTDCSGSSRVLNVRGTSEWERLQSDICPDVDINALGENSFVKSKGIKSVRLIESEGQDSLTEFPADVWSFNLNGQLEKHALKFHVSFDGEIEPSTEIIYFYNQRGYLIGDSVKTYALVDGTGRMIPCHAYPDTIVTLFDGNRIIRQFRVEHEEMNCTAYYQISENGLISKIELFYDKKSVLVKRFMYEFW
ncbi:MAG: hypothetical protein JKX84_08995 [Flavobacteriales bacterium]|nr:hypothetical protein [Flavobacteriales bacterium]